MEAMTKYEKARIIGSRALQLAMGAPFLLKFSEKDLEKINFNPVEIAKKELEAGVIPISIVRSIPEHRPEETEAKAA